MDGIQAREEYENAIVEAFFDEAVDEEIDSLINCLPDVPAETIKTLPNRTTPLMASLLSKRYQYVKKLLEKMSEDEINMKSPYGSTALTLAASDNTAEGMEAVRQLIDANADVTVKDEMGWGVLTKIVLNSPDSSLIELLVKKGADVNEISEIKMTPLMVSTKRRDGQCDFAKLLVEMGAKKDIQTTDGSTAYDFAKEAGNQDIMDLLEPDEAHVGEEENEGNQGIMDLLKTQLVNTIEQIQLITAQLTQNIALVPAIQRGDALCMLPQEIPHSPDEISGRTRLMSAATGFDSKNLEDLLKEGKEDVHARDENGWTALHYALTCRSENTLSALLDSGADPNVTDNKTICALSYAIIAKFYGALELLLEKGANPNLPDACGRTPLFYLLASDITLRERDDVLEILLKHGANIMWKDKDGITPLCLAEKKNDGSAEILKK
jgi:ankyrin repeat protein